MATFLAHMMSAGTAAGQTRPEGGVRAALGPARPAGAPALAVHGLWTAVVTSLIGSS
jgi:hypothetical protein